MILNLCLTTLAVAIVPAWARGRIALRGSPLPSPTYAFGSPIEVLDLPEPTIAPDLANRAAEIPQDRLTVHITNRFGQNLPISYQSNSGSPTIIDLPGPSNHFLANSFTNVVVPRNFAGVLFIGKSFDPANSKIEFSFSPPEYRVALDVSYVDGYSVPITCSCNGVPQTGCNILLASQGRTCSNPGSGGQHVICYNPKKTVPDGPADPFFQPCQGAAYTYPNDHGAQAFGRCETNYIECCVGHDCPAPSFQHGKRSLEEWGFGNETEYPAGSV
ncbi:MAG: hypothetical protein Q9168_002710 [Polycauliona sp. 1 TL-2023]